VAAVYTSVIRRAVETAEVLAPALDAPESVPRCDWCELHMEPVDGLTWDQLRDRHPVDGDPDHPDRPRVAGAETWSALYERIGTNLHRIAADHPGERVVVVTHAGSIGASLVAFGHVPVADAITVIRSIRNTSLTEWHHRDGRWHLDRFDDATHIEATPDLHDPPPP
jgi:probable phosphoglycerate mutase